MHICRYGKLNYKLENDAVIEKNCILTYGEWWFFDYSPSNQIMCNNNLFRMDKLEMIKELNVLFQNVLKKGEVKLEVESTTDDVEGWDSLTNMLIINTIEKTYNIKFGFREIIKLKNVGDLCDAIIKKTA